MYKRQDIDKAKAKELAKVDKLERTYWEAWERSLEALERRSTRMSGTITKEVDAPDGSKRFVQETPTQQAFTTVERLGDSRYLQGVQWCIERRCKILGIDAPEKHNLSSDHTFHVVHDQDTPADEA